MPSSTLGFTGTEIVSRVISYVGNTSSVFQTYVENTLPLAEFRYCSMHPWKFLYKPNLSLSVVNGTDEYDLSVANIGYYMAAEDVHQIFDQTNGRVLAKSDLKDFRRLDPKHDDGSATDKVTMWAPLGDNRIILYPPTFASATLKIDGWISPGALTTLSNYPTIPFRYQEGFIEYVIAKALDRDNDDRAEAKKSEAMQLIMADVRKDMTQKGSVDLPRVRSWAEANVDGVGGADLQSLYLNYLFS
jgi:hypothetical protein